jgi:hypothetical protein
MRARELGVALAKRLAVAALAVVLVVAASFAFAAPDATAGPTDRAALTTPEYDAERLATTPAPAEGEVDVAASAGGRSGIVVIDRSHSNRIGRADLAPLVEAVTSVGYSVRFHDGSRTLDQALSNANAFVVVDPTEEFERNEVTTVRTFTREGGHLLLVGEPTRVQPSGTLLATSFSAEESALTALAARYDASLGTEYLYNLETNGGNYRHVVAEPTPESGLDLDSVTMFTAASVHARGGTVLLRATPNTHESGTDGTAAHPVAVHKERANVVVLGDSSFLRTDRVTVGDNERFAAFLVEFLVSGERTGAAAVEEAARDDDQPD